MALSLSLNEENIYAAGYIVEFSDGTKILKRDPIVYNPAANKDKTYTLKQSEHLWDLAFTNYNNSKWWHVLGDVNKIFNPFEIPVGTELIIPDLDVIRAGR